MTPQQRCLRSPERERRRQWAMLDCQQEHGFEAEVEPLRWRAAAWLIGSIGCATWLVVIGAAVLLWCAFREMLAWWW